MLTLPEWRSINLTVKFFSTKYKMHSAGCPSLPEHMRVQVCVLDELPCYTGIDRDEYTTNDWDNGEEYEGSSETITDGRSTDSNSSFSNQDSTEENVDEHIDWREELDEHAEKNSSPSREDPEQSYIIIDSPVRTFASIQSGCFDIADNIDRYELDDEFGGKLGQQANRPCSTKTDAYHDPLPTKNACLSSEVEVIDLFTPPCYKVGADNKKRRLSTTCPEIIDLTDTYLCLMY
ncbi:hypothetical protein RND71_031693 [Anisodus tanguticus]|uniref:Uncharacterized protein n=1 Tax=Anisodus tanguticus TaxID=243964 RepID=A0AAE1UXQ5_9SOLA|nr:hypothetical protein RND71_031693 [Anisodus tanguticus]